MKVQTPQISWHGRDAVLSVDFQFVQGEVRRLATGGIDAHVVVWYYNLCEKSVVTIECASDLNRHNKSVNVVRFSPNGEYLASGDDEGAIFIWKLREKILPDLDGEEGNVNKEDWYVFKILRGHIDDISDLSWSSDSDFLMSGSIDNSTIIWDIQKGQNVRISKEAKSFVQGVTWDPLNQFQATISSDRMLRIYNTSSGKVVHRIHKDHWTESTTDKGSKKVAKLFHDDTLQSYCRRLQFSPDGELLFVPSGIKEKGEDFIHTTYVFSRYDFTRPILNLPSGQKYTVAVCCCPVLYKLQGDVENLRQRSMVNLPYRLLIAVATQDSILMYDTQQLLPFALVCNIHYRHLTDLAWSSDGRMLLVSSSDGYCSFIIFGEGELGEIYIPGKKIEGSPVSNAVTTPVAVTPNQKSVKKNGKAEPLSVVEKVANVDLEKETLIFGETEKSPNSSMSKTPKQVPVATKKSPKMLSIKRFFSTPDRSKVKIIGDSDDCLIIEEKLNAQVEKPNYELPTSVVTDIDEDSYKTETGIISLLEKEICVVSNRKARKLDGGDKSTIESSNQKLFPELNQAKFPVVNRNIKNYTNLTGKNYTLSRKRFPPSDLDELQKLIDIPLEVKVVLDSLKDKIEQSDCAPNLSITKSSPVSMEEDAMISDSFIFPKPDVISVPCSKVKSTLTSTISLKISSSTQDIEMMDVQDSDTKSVSSSPGNASDYISPCSTTSTNQVQQLALSRSNFPISNGPKSSSENKPKKRIPFITLSTKTSK